MRQIANLKTVTEVGKGLESELAVSTSIIYLTVALEIITSSLPYHYFHFICFRYAQSCTLHMQNGSSHTEIFP